MRINGKKKISTKKLLLYFVILVIICLMTYIVISSLNKDNSLSNIGYSNLEITEIKKLTKSEIATIKKYKYNKNLTYIISSENYDPNKLDLYLKYTDKYNDIDYLKIFNLINNKEFNIDKINKYVELLYEYDNVDEVVLFVNKYGDSNIELNNTTLSFINEKYFLEDYLDRYLKYYSEHKDLTYTEIVTRINSNLDYTFYTDSKSADLSKGMYTLVNKYNSLDKDYVPEDIVSAEKEYTLYNGKLNKTAYENFVKMADAIKKEGLCIKITTGYRSYSFQSTLYNNYVAADGVENADTYSARPGFSEHQLGYSADLTNGQAAGFDEFVNTKEYAWLNDNAYKYGFILRYPKGKEYITGYMFESWHYRYVGTEISNYIHDNNITYEEYFAYFLR